MDYQALQDAVTGFMHRSDLVPQYDTFFNLAHAEILQRINFPKSIQSKTYGAGDASLIRSSIYGVTLPDELDEVISVSSDQGEFEMMTPGRLLGDYHRAGSRYPVGAVKGRELWTIGAHETMIVLYEGGPAFFASAAATNEISSRFPNCYVYGALVHANRFVQDPEEEGANQGQFDRACDQAADLMKVIVHGPAPAMRSDYGDMANGR